MPPSSATARDDTRARATAQADTRAPATGREDTGTVLGVVLLVVALVVPGTLVWLTVAILGITGVASGAAFLERVDGGEAAAWIPAIVLVEVLEAAHRGVIRLAGGSEAWVSGLLESGSFFVADLAADVALRADALYAIPERGDRLIAATAARLDLPLVIRDPELARSAGVPVLW